VGRRSVRGIEGRAGGGERRAGKKKSNADTPSAGFLPRAPECTSGIRRPRGPLVSAGASCLPSE
jgi:hypothetical protein